ncbi:MAG: patatin-like phospholipase family protein [Gammaproteobacteria bacterium]
MTTGAAATRDFDQLAVPFRAIATDLVSGEMVVFKDGDLESAMRASMSIPGVIAPTEIGERLLVDGGLVRNLPVDIVRAMGVDRVIAVNLGTPL